MPTARDVRFQFQMRKESPVNFKTVKTAFGVTTKYAKEGRKEGASKTYIQPPNNHRVSEMKSSRNKRPLPTMTPEFSLTFKPKNSSIEVISHRNVLLQDNAIPKLSVLFALRWHPS